MLEPAKHKDAVRNLFILLIDATMGIQEQELFTPAPEALARRAELPYPEMHEESLGELKFIKTCIRLMSICGISDFGIKDLFNPCSKRLRRHLSAAINFLRFMEDKAPLYAELNKERQTNVQALNLAKEEHITLKAQLDQAQQEHEQDWLATQEAEKECAEIELEITRQNKLQASIRQENNTLKKIINDLMDKIATTTLALQETKAEEQKMMSQVVKSPDRLKRDLKDVTVALESLKKETAKEERKITLTKKKIDNLARAKVELLKALEKLEELQMETTKLHELEEEVQAVRKRLSTSAKETNELIEQAEDMQRHITRTEEKIAHQRKQHAVKMEAAHEALETAQKELLNVEKERREGMSRVNAAEAASLALEARIAQDREMHRADLLNMWNEYKTLERFMLQKDSEIMKAIGCE